MLEKTLNTTNLIGAYAAVFAGINVQFRLDEMKKGRWPDVTEGKSYPLMVEPDHKVALQFIDDAGDEAVFDGGHDESERMTGTLIFDCDLDKLDTLIETAKPGLVPYPSQWKLTEEQQAKAQTMVRELYDYAHQIGMPMFIVATLGRDGTNEEVQQAHVNARAFGRSSVCSARHHQMEQGGSGSGGLAELLASLAG